MKSAYPLDRQASLRALLAYGVLVAAPVSDLAGEAAAPETTVALPSQRVEITADVRLAHPVIPGDQPQRSYLQVDLMPAAADVPSDRLTTAADGYSGRGAAQRSDLRAIRPSERLPVNLAVVLDRSATMQGERLRHAVLAVERVLDWLQEDDVVAIVAYNSNIQVLQAATSQPDRERLARLLEQLGARGHSNLFGGVTQGAAQLRRFSSSDRVSRVLLLSDGKATIGPGTPKALGELGASLRKEGISVSTIGLGLDYNEDLMVELAVQSQGNHHFVEHPQDLVAAFEQELRQLESIEATDVVLRLEFAPGITPVRSLGVTTEIHGRAVTARIGQVLTGQITTVLLEVLIDPAEVQPGAQVVALELSRMDPAAAASSAKPGMAMVLGESEPPRMESSMVAVEEDSGAVGFGIAAQAGLEGLVVMEESAEAMADMAPPPAAEFPPQPAAPATAAVAEASEPSVRQRQTAEAPMESAAPRRMAAESVELFHDSTADDAALAAPSDEADHRSRGGEAGEGAIRVQATAAKLLPQEPGEPGMPQITLTDQSDEVTRNADVSILALVLEQQARELRERAIELRDGGEIDAAEELLLRNSAELEAFSQRYAIESLSRQAQQQKAAAESLGSTGEEWERARKELRARNVRNAGPGVIPAAVPEAGVEADQSALESAAPIAREPLD